MRAPVDYQASISAFLEQIAAADARVSGLRARDGAQPSHPGTLESALSELDVAFEELHTAEEELRAQNDELTSTRYQVEAERHRYRELFENAPLAYLVTDAAGVIREANRAGCELLCRPARYLRGKPLAIFAPQQERGAIRNLISEVMDGASGARRADVILSPTHGRPFNAQLVAERISGDAASLATIRWMVVDRALLDASSTPVGSWEQQLVAATRESVDEVVVAMDADNVVTGWNRAAELTFGYTAAEVLGKPSPILPSAHTGEQVFQRKDGRHLTLRVSRMFEGASSSTHGRLFRMTRIRADRRQATSEDRHLVAGRLAGGMAHHLNNILQVMVFATELSRRETTDPEQLSKDLQTIKDAAFKAASILRALIRYTGQEHTWPKPTNLNALVDAEVAKARAEFPPRITCTVLLDDAVPPVNVDSDAIARVVGELLASAVRSIESEGTVTVQTMASPDEADVRTDRRGVNGYVRLAVRDTGRGMDSATRAKMFEPFPMDNGASNPAGLGLAAAWGSVTKAGGFIRVESGSPGGTLVSIFLPVPETSESAPSVAAEPAISSPHQFRPAS